MKVFTHLDATELKAWRSELEMTQAEAAKWFGIARGTYINWENGSTPIPPSAATICSVAHKRRKMRDLFGPVTLVYTDAPMWQSAYGANRIPMMQNELYPSTHEAIHRARILSHGGQAHGLLIMDEAGDVTWNAVELNREFHMRSEQYPRIPVVTASEAKRLGRRNRILEATVKPSKSGWQDVVFHILEPMGDGDLEFELENPLHQPHDVKEDLVDDVLQEKARQYKATFICKDQNGW
nr:DUF1870 family protein [uncultured Dongia sp.]